MNYKQATVIGVLLSILFFVVVLLATQYFPLDLKCTYTRSNGVMTETCGEVVTHYF